MHRFEIVPKFQLGDRVLSDFLKVCFNNILQTARLRALLYGMGSGNWSLKLEKQLEQ